MREIWKDIEGYEGLYQVSNYGRIKRFYKSGKEKILKPSKQSRGYYFVRLYKNGKAKNSTVHRLVAEAFIPNPDNKPTVNHKDEDKTNNHINNLEWMTSAENNNYGTHNKRVSEARKKPVICLETGIIYQSATDASKLLLINQGTINSCLKGRLKAVGGYHWEYLDNV